MGCGCSGSTYVPPTADELAAHAAAGTTPPAPPALTGPQSDGYFHTDEPPAVAPAYDAAGHAVPVEA